MKKLMLSLLFLVPSVVFAAGGHAVHLDDAGIDLADKKALANGAKYFVNYCQNCHSAKYMRYKKMEEIGLTEDQIRDNLMFVGDNVRGQMEIAMRTQDAETWFGAPPPDLTLTARLRGEDWLFTYLRSFYLDPKRPLGVNNTVFPDVGMPHVLWELQGLQKAVVEEHTDSEGKTTHTITGLELVQPGKMSPEEYDTAVRDLVTFLAWMGEPMKLERQRLGIWVLLFLAIFTVIAYFLKKEYWKDVH